MLVIANSSSDHATRPAAARKTRGAAPSPGNAAARANASGTVVATPMRPAATARPRRRSSTVAAMKMTAEHPQRACGPPLVAAVPAVEGQSADQRTEHQHHHLGHSGQQLVGEGFELAGRMDRRGVGDVLDDRRRGRPRRQLAQNQLLPVVDGQRLERGVQTERCTTQRRKGIRSQAIGDVFFGCAVRRRRGRRPVSRGSAGSIHGSPAWSAARDRRPRRHR